jgi:hypothetical protein
MPQMAEVRIGTSGYWYPHWRKGVFYPTGLPAKQELAYYAARFRTVELNTPGVHLLQRRLGGLCLAGCGHIHSTHSVRFAAGFRRRGASDSMGYPSEMIPTTRKPSGTRASSRTAGSRMMPPVLR